MSFSCSNLALGCGQYGTTGWGVFKGGIQNWKYSNDNNNWSNGKLSKMGHHFRKLCK